MEAICADFAAEADDLDSIVSAKGVDIHAPTPSPGWSVRDQISHLWYFDRRALLALVDPDAFTAEAEQLISSGGTQASVEAGRRMDDRDLLRAWRDDRQLLIDEARTRDPRSGSRGTAHR